jgi:hypothetical protein
MFAGNGYLRLALFLIECRCVSTTVQFCLFVPRSGSIRPRPVGNAPHLPARQVPKAPNVVPVAMAVHSLAMLGWLEVRFAHGVPIDEAALVGL